MQKRTTKGLKGAKGRTFQYELSFMRMVAREYATGNLSWRQLADKHKITIHQVRGWISRFSDDLVERTIPSAPDMTPAEQQAQDDLKKQNEELARKLAYAHLKITGLEMMIDIAETELDIDIRKKSGTKPSAE